VRDGASRFNLRVFGREKKKIKGKSRYIHYILEKKGRRLATFSIAKTNLWILRSGETKLIRRSNRRSKRTQLIAASGRCSKRSYLTKGRTEHRLKGTDGGRGSAASCNWMSSKEEREKVVQGCFKAGKRRSRPLGNCGRERGEKGIKW